MALEPTPTIEDEDDGDENCPADRSQDPASACQEVLESRRQGRHD